MDATTHCPRCDAPRSSLVRDGFYHRIDDSKFIQRIRCKDCSKKFSNATFTKTYRQKRRRINQTVRLCLASNMCPRDIAELVSVNIKTVASRLVWLAKLSREKNHHNLQAFLLKHGPITTVQFDDLLTFEHTNCKPLTVPMAVIDEVRIPLGFRIASIPAFGRLAALSRARYGKRADASYKARHELFQELKALLPSDVHFKTDGHKQYPKLINKYFPQATHSIHISDRGSVVGQGELKKTRFDPLFTVNHSFANIRAKVNRLNRRTWCTTKHPDRLADHIDIYIDVLCDRLARQRKIEESNFAAA